VPETLSFLLLLLGCRHVLALVGAVPANPENIAVIKEKKANCSVVVGGVSEMFLQSESQPCIEWSVGVDLMRMYFGGGVLMPPTVSCLIWIHMLRFAA
jgi:hypothetical protein